jgi:hypothetical protein
MKDTLVKATWYLGGSFALAFLGALLFGYQGAVLGAAGAWGGHWLYERHRAGRLSLRLGLPKRQKQEPLPPLPKKK